MAVLLRHTNIAVELPLGKRQPLVENVFARLKHFRAIATRYDKLKRNFSGTVALASAFLWLLI
jgi:transposase